MSRLCGHAELLVPGLHKEKPMPVGIIQMCKTLTVGLHVSILYVQHMVYFAHLQSCLPVAVLYV